MHGFGAGRVGVNHTFEFNATPSFLFSCLEKAFTRVVSSLILAFKSLMSSALFCCLLARLCLEALKLALLVADRILFSACSGTFGLVRNHGGSFLLEGVDGLSVCINFLFLLLDHELEEVQFRSFEVLVWSDVRSGLHPRQLSRIIVHH